MGPQLQYVVDHWPFAIVGVGLLVGLAVWLVQYAAGRAEARAAAEQAAEDALAGALAAPLAQRQYVPGVGWQATEPDPVPVGAALRGRALPAPVDSDDPVEDAETGEETAEVVAPVVEVYSPPVGAVRPLWQEPLPDEEDEEQEMLLRDRTDVMLPALAPVVETVTAALADPAEPDATGVLQGTGAVPEVEPHESSDDQEPDGVPDETPAHTPDPVEDSPADLDADDSPEHDEDALADDDAGDEEEVAAAPVVEVALKPLDDSEDQDDVPAPAPVLSQPVRVSVLPADREPFRHVAPDYDENLDTAADDTEIPEVTTDVDPIEAEQADTDDAVVTQGDEVIPQVDTAADADQDEPVTEAPVEAADEDELALPTAGEVTAQPLTRRALRELEQQQRQGRGLGLFGRSGHERTEPEPAPPLLLPHDDETTPHVGDWSQHIQTNTTEHPDDVAQHGTEESPQGDQGEPSDAYDSPWAPPSPAETPAEAPAAGELGDSEVDDFADGETVDEYPDDYSYEEEVDEEPVKKGWWAARKERKAQKRAAQQDDDRRTENAAWLETIPDTSRGLVPAPWPLPAQQSADAAAPMSWPSAHTDTTEDVGDEAAEPAADDRAPIWWPPVAQEPATDVDGPKQDAAPANAEQDIDPEPEVDVEVRNEDDEAHDQRAQDEDPTESWNPLSVPAAPFELPPLTSAPTTDTDADVSAPADDDAEDDLDDAAATDSAPESAEAWNPLGVPDMVNTFGIPSSSSPFTPATDVAPAPAYGESDAPSWLTPSWLTPADSDSPERDAVSPAVEDTTEPASDETTAVSAPESATGEDGPTWPLPQTPWEPATSGFQELEQPDADDELPDTSGDLEDVDAAEPVEQWAPTVTNDVEEQRAAQAAAAQEAMAARDADATQRRQAEAERAAAAEHAREERERNRRMDAARRAAEKEARRLDDERESARKQAAKQAEAEQRYAKKKARQDARRAKRQLRTSTDSEGTAALREAAAQMRAAALAAAAPRTDGPLDLGHAGSIEVPELHQAPEPEQAEATAFVIGSSRRHVADIDHTAYDLPEPLPRAARHA